MQRLCRSAYRQVSLGCTRRASQLRGMSWKPRRPSARNARSRELEVRRRGRDGAPKAATMATMQQQREPQHGGGDGHPGVTGVVGRATEGQVGKGAWSRRPGLVVAEVRRGDLGLDLVGQRALLLPLAGQRHRLRKLAPATLLGSRRAERLADLGGARRPVERARSTAFAGSRRQRCRHLAEPIERRRLALEQAEQQRRL